MQVMMKSGVYTIENTTNGHRYVGSAMNLGKRWTQHRVDLRRGAHRNDHLQRAWNKHGEGAFQFDVLEEWEPEFLISMEQWWMNMLRPEYNIRQIAGSQLGCKRTEETRARISAARIGKKRSAESVAKTAAANTGRKYSAESRVRMSLAQKGRVITKEARAKLRAANMGKKASAETRAKMSAAQRGNQNCLGHKHSEVTRAKMSAAHRRRLANCVPE